MNDTDLDARLSESAPAASPPLGLAAHRGRIMAEARARRSHRARLGIASAAASLALIGGGSMAMAGNGGQTPWGWVADNVFSTDRPDGSFCFKGIRVMFDGVSGGSDIARDARDIVTSIDLDSLDTTEAEARARADDAAAVDLDGEPAPIHDSEDQVRLRAIDSIVAHSLFDGLAERGYSETEIAQVSLESRTTGCE
ncbi:hypothetical protein [Labedella endophytica]|uniref:Uncharacterized protein n=1 Tax=Labedella endophytica TaxID=1523160 RepID=A0A433JQ67_9MICO|nr:hypothetical protein [Labedella endophytica]RUQ99089.1 hypothetical protein ELQ94_12300 [Labedella endophytica]